MKKRSLYLIGLVIALFGESNVPQEQFNAITDDTYDQLMFDWSRTWAEVMHHVKDKHYKLVYVEKSMAKAIDAFLNNVDPHSNFLDHDTYKTMIESTNGEFYGVGIIIDNTRKAKDKSLTIVDIISDGPADKVGIKQYDKIVEIGNKQLEGITTEEAIALLKGPKDTVVQVKILREGHTDLLSFDIKRDIVKNQSALSFYIKKHQIYYISLSMFTRNVVQQVESLLALSNNHPYKGLIIDLRNNSGGLLTSAIEIAGLFLDKNSLVVTTKDKHQQQIEQFKTARDPVMNNLLPLVILINNYTASAAEILAGCLKIHSETNDQKQPLMVFLVGTSTFGKGSVQEVIPVGSNSAIKLTTALYFLPDDTTVQAKGIQPDFTVERCLQPTEQILWFTESYGREINLPHYIKVEADNSKITDAIEPKKETSNRWEERIKTMLQTDNQLREAINLLTILEMAQHNVPHLIKNRASALSYLKKNHVSQETLEIEEVKL